MIGKELALWAYHKYFIAKFHCVIFAFFASGLTLGLNVFTTTSICTEESAQTELSRKQKQSPNFPISLPAQNKISLG